MSSPHESIPNGELGRQVYDKVLSIFERAYALDSEVHVEEGLGTEEVYGQRADDDPDGRIVLRRPPINRMDVKAQFWVLPEYTIWQFGQENGIVPRHINVSDDGFIAEHINPEARKFDDMIFRPLGSGDIHDLLDMLEQADFNRKSPST